MAKNDGYWDSRKRAEQKWQEQNLRNDDAYNRTLNKYYQQATDGIMARIDAEYNRFASSQGYSYADAKKSVGAADMARFSSEAADLVKQAQKAFSADNSPDASLFTEEVNSHMKLYNATMRINRLEYLKAQVGMEASKLGVKVSADLGGKLSDDYLAERKRQSAFLGDYLPKTELTNYKRAFKTVMDTRNHGGFSASVWKNMDAMTAELNVGLTNLITQGLNPRVMAGRLREFVQDTATRGTYAAERLARTESARVQSIAQDDCYRELKIKDVKWIEEPSACKTCLAIASDHDGVYALTDSPTIPVHPNCRCSKAPHADREKMERLIAAARDERAVGVEIDEFTPCLRDMKTGKLVDTEYHDVTISSAKAIQMMSQGWLFDWSKVDDANRIVELNSKDDPTPQGYVAFHDDEGFTKLDLVESAPYNRGGDKQYNGVGPHLFAIAAESSFQTGNDGYVSFTPKTKLHDYYARKLGALDLPNGDQYLDTRTSRKLIDIYMKGL